MQNVNVIAPHCDSKISNILTTLIHLKNTLAALKAASQTHTF